MGKFGYEGSDKFEPLSAWQYFGWELLFSLPVVGWIVLVATAIGCPNINRRNLARGYFVRGLMYLVVFVLLLVFSSKIRQVVKILLP